MQNKNEVYIYNFTIKIYNKNFINKNEEMSNNVHFFAILS